jgi:hypothetical protein
LCEPFACTTFRLEEVADNLSYIDAVCHRPYKIKAWILLVRHFQRHH